MRSGGDQDHVGWNGLLAIRCLGDHAFGSVEAGTASHQLDVFALQSLSDVAGLSIRKIKNALVHCGQVYAYAGVDVALIKRAEPQPEISRLADIRHHLGRSDQGFRGNTVGENGGAAKPIAVNQCGLAAQPSGDQRCLVTTRTSADNHYPGHLRILPSP